MSDANGNQLRQAPLGEGNAGLEKIKIPPIDTTGIELGSKIDTSELGGFAARPIEITGIADKIKPEGAGGLELKADLGKIDQGMRKIREQQKNAQIQAWIDEAQAAIERHDYDLAIRLLNKVTQADSASGQALFLLGYCYFALQQFSEATEALHQARTHAKSQDLLFTILMLDVLCTRAEMAALESNLTKLLSDNRHSDALKLVEAQLRRRSNDPGFLYYKCGILFVMGRTKQAKQAAMTALKSVGSGHTHLFQKLLTAITNRESDKHYEEMRKAMRKRNWGQVNRLLITHETKLKGQPQYTIIRTYVNDKLSGDQAGGFFSSIVGRIKSVAMRQDDLQKMLFWLLSDELTEGMAALDAEQYEAAHNVFSKAERIDTRCGVMCFMHALSLFRLFEQLAKQQPDFDRALKLIAQASQLLTTAVKDRVVSQRSQGLKNVVDGYLNELQKVGKQRQDAEQEGKAIGALFDEFNTTMEYYSQHPISSRSELQRAQKKIADLNRRVTKQCAKHQRGSEAWQALIKLEDAVSNVQRQLNI